MIDLKFALGGWLMLIQPYLNDFGFDSTEAYGFALAVKLLTRNSEHVSEIVQTYWGVSRPQLMVHGGIRLLLAQNDFMQLAVFGGRSMISACSVLLSEATLTRPYGDAHRDCFDAVVPLLKPLQEMIAARRGRALRIAGHGFGAGLATLAALELSKAMTQPAKVIALGAPRVVRLPAWAPAEPDLGAEVVRVVNDDDLVARLAADCEPFGETIWLDECGVAQPESALPSNLAAPIKADEIEALREDIGWIGHNVSGPMPVPDAVTRGAEATLQGLFPGLRAHTIDSYLRALRRLGGGHVDTLRQRRSTLRETSAAAVEFETFVVEQRATMASEGRPAGQPLISVLLELNPPTWTPPAGVRFQSRIGPYATARLTAAQLDVIRRDSAVKFAAIGREEGAPELIRTLPLIRADDAGLVSIAERGDSALFALIDSGIDILHEAFRDADGKSRIVGVWHQAGVDAPSPYAVHPGFSQDYGTLYTGAEIARIISSSDPVADILRDPNLEGHGTHVASIGAGRAFGAAGRGVAPMAKILVVIPHVQVAPGDPESVGFSISHVDALSFIAEVAKGGNPLLTEPLPVAVNMSFDCNTGAHDGKSTLEAAIDALTGIGRTPGQVIVKSAGNERGSASHARVFPTAAWLAVDWEAQASNRDRDYVEAWFNCRDEFEFRLSCPAGVVDALGAPIHSLTATPDQPTGLVDMGGNQVSLRLTRFHPDNGDHMLAADIARSLNPIHPGIWRLEVRAIHLASVQKALDLWFERRRDPPLRFVAPDPNYTLSVPGTAETVVTVSACDLMACMPVFSSCGPTRNGSAKPDVCAPGSGILAADSNTGPTAVKPMSGTSMAAPHVAGLFALALSHRHKQAQLKQFSANQLRQMLNRSTRDFPRMHNHESGYGLVDAAAFFREVMRHS